MCVLSSDDMMEEEEEEDEEGAEVDEAAVLQVGVGVYGLCLQQLPTASASTAVYCTVLGGDAPVVNGLQAGGVQFLTGHVV